MPVLAIHQRCLDTSDEYRELAARVGAHVVSNTACAVTNAATDAACR